MPFCLHRTLGKKNRKPLQNAISGAYPRLAQDVSFTAHCARSLGEDPVVRFRPLREGYRPLSGTERRHLTTIGRKCPTTKDAATTSTSTRDSTRVESSAWRTKIGRWHPGAPCSFKMRGIVTDGRSWGGPGLEIEKTGGVHQGLQCNVEDLHHHLGGSRCTAHNVWQIGGVSTTSLRNVGYREQSFRRRWP